MLFEKTAALSENVSVDRFGYVGTYHKGNTEEENNCYVIYKWNTHFLSSEKGRRRVGGGPTHFYSSFRDIYFKTTWTVFPPASDIYFMVRTLNEQQLETRINTVLLIILICRTYTDILVIRNYHLFRSFYAIYFNNEYLFSLKLFSLWQCTQCTVNAIVSYILKFFFPYCQGIYYCSGF